MITVVPLRGDLSATAVKLGYRVACFERLGSPEPANVMAALVQGRGHSHAGMGEGHIHRISIIHVLSRVCKFAFRAPTFGLWGRGSG